MKAAGDSFWLWFQKRVETGWVAQRWNSPLPEGGSFRSQEDSGSTWTHLWQKCPLRASTEWWEQTTFSNPPKTKVYDDMSNEAEKTDVSWLLQLVVLGALVKHLRVHQICSPFPAGPELTSRCLPVPLTPLQLAGWRGSLLTSPPEMIFQENSKKCYSFEMRTWPLVHCSILIHGLLAIAHLLLEIN